MPPFSRTRTGCFTCREDGYKCDEQKPHCGRCIRLNKVCKGYGVKLKWRTIEGPPTAAQTKQRGKRQQRNAKPKSPTKMGPDGSDDQAGFAALSPSSFPLQSPTTGSEIIARNPSYLALDPGMADQQRYLMHHWTTVLATVVSMAAGPRNPFLVHLTPMAAQSTAVRSAVCSMAASHLAILRKGGSGSSVDNQSQWLQTSALHHRVMAVSSLRQSLQTQDPELSLATVLLLQVSDRLFATDTRVDHLAGAKAIIAAGRGAASRGGGKQPRAWDTASAAFLLSLCFYHDVLASVARGTSPLLEFSEGGNNPSHESRVPVETMAMEGVESMGGLTAVLQIVGRISRMRAMVSTPEQDAEGHAIEAALNALETSPIAAVPVADNEDGEEGEDEIGASVGVVEADIDHTIQAYKHAAFIYLYRVWFNVGAPHPLTLKHAQSSLRHLNAVALSSPLLSAHVWPLWTAGCETIDAEQRRSVCERVDAMYGVRHLPSLRRIRLDIEEVWKIKDDQRSSTGVDNVDCIKAILENRKREADIA